MQEITGGCVPSVVVVPSTDTQESVQSVTDELGRSWVVIPDELWERRETCEYQFGYPIYVTQFKH